MLQVFLLQRWQPNPALVPERSARPVHSGVVMTPSVWIGRACLTLALVGLATATGCGSAGRTPRSEGARTPTAHLHPTSAPAAVGCPHALSPGRRAYGHAARAVLSNLRRLFPNYDTRHTDILGLYFLLSTVRPAVPKAIRRGPARKACGNHVIDRSWAAVIVVPNAPDADHGTAVVYVARTSAGWRPWYLWLPYAPGGHLIS
jgi:hypothetical protein